MLLLFIIALEDDKGRSVYVPHDTAVRRENVLQSRLAVMVIEAFCCLKYSNLIPLVDDLCTLFY